MIAQLIGANCDVDAHECKDVMNRGARAGHDSSVRNVRVIDYCNGDKHCVKLCVGDMHLVCCAVASGMVSTCCSRWAFIFHDWRDARKRQASADLG